MKINNFLKIFSDICEMRALKILQLSSEKSWRGGEQQIAYLILYLKSQNVDVVVCARKDSSFSQWCGENEILCYDLSFRNGVDIKTVLRIKQIAEKEKVDIVNAHSGKSHSLAYLACKFGLDKPLVVHRRVDFPLKTKGFSLAKFNHKNVKAIICVSNAIASLVKRVVQNPERVKTVYSGIDPQRFNHDSPTGYIHDEFDIDRNKMLIANISAIAPHKNYKVFLRTAKEVSATRKDCHFLIVGDGPLKSETQKFAKTLNLNDRVTFTGFRKDIPVLFRELTLFLITSDTEGLGTTVIDALYNGIPVVATRAGGIPELIINEKQGYLCDIDDYNCLAEKINRLLDSEKLRREMAKNAFQRSMRFTNKQMGAGVLEIYQEILT